MASFVLSTRLGPRKNRPLEFRLKTEFLQFFSATQLAHSIDKNLICLAHSVFSFLDEGRGPQVGEVTRLGGVKK